MNRLELRTAIRGVLREPTAARWSDADINSYINNALEEVSRALLRRKTATASVAIDTDTVTIPTDCLIISHMFWVDADDNVSEIEREFDDQIPIDDYEDDDDDDTGVPDKYWLIDDAVTLRPIPAAAGTVKFVYYYSLPELDEDTDSPALDGLDRFIKAHGIYEAYFDDGDPRYEIWKQRKVEELLSFLSVESSKYGTGFKVKESF